MTKNLVYETQDVRAKTGEAIEGLRHVRVPDRRNSAAQGFVGVIGFNDPYPHWTVATNQAGPHSVRLFDSDVFETVDMRRTVIGKTNGKTWEIDPTAVVIIDRIA